jgi:hypothetical protein
LENKLRKDKNCKVSIYSVDDYLQYESENKLKQQSLFCPSCCDPTFLSLLNKYSEPNVARVYVYEFESGIIVIPLIDARGEIKRVFSDLYLDFGIMFIGDRYKVDFSSIFNKSYMFLEFIRLDYGGLEIYNSVSKLSETREDDKFKRCEARTAGAILLNKNDSIDNILKNNSRRLRSNISRVLNKKYEIEFDNIDFVFSAIQFGNQKYPDNHIDEDIRDIASCSNNIDYIKELYDKGLIVSSRFSVDGYDSFEYGVLYNSEYHAIYGGVPKTNYSLSHAYVALIKDHLYKMGIKYYNHLWGFQPYKYVWNDWKAIPNFVFELWGSTFSK